MREKISQWVFRFVKGCVKAFYPKMRVEGAENLPGEPSIIVGNHCQMNGPIVGELYVPDEPYIWCAGEMMHRKDVPGYAFRDFWSGKPKWTHPFYKLLSYLIAPLSACIFNHARTIGVYHDTRILSTFKGTVKRLQEGRRVVIFPESDTPYNTIVYEFHDRFVDVAKLYYQRTGKELSFVPMYVAPALKTIYFGCPIRFCGTESVEAERKRISQYLMEQITQIACSLPRHKVVPFKNIPKKQYPFNTPEAAACQEKSGKGSEQWV